MSQITEGSKKKFLLPGGQRFYFKVSDLVNTINGKKEVFDNDLKAISIEYGVHSVDSLSGSTGQGRGMNSMYFGENRLTKLKDVGSTIDEEGQKGSLICFDTFALGQGGSGTESNTAHDIYNVGFKITIDNTKPICLKSFVVKKNQDNYFLVLRYVGDDEGSWEKNESESDLEYGIPIYWDKNEENRKISQGNLLNAKVNLQIIDGKDLNEKISEAKIKESQAIPEYPRPDNEGNALFLFAESGKYLYKEESIPTDKDNNKKSGPTSWLKFVGKFVPIPVLIFLLMFFVMNAGIIYAIVCTVLSIIAELIVYRMFFHENRSKNDRHFVESIETLELSKTEESMRDKIAKSTELKEKIEKLQWKYGTVEFDGFDDGTFTHEENHTMIFRYKQDGAKDNQIVCIQYCICPSDSVSVSENKLGTCRVHTERFPDSEITIELNVEKDLYLKVDNTLTFCDEDGNPLDESVSNKLNAIINLDDKSDDLKTLMDKAAKNKIGIRLIEN